jgi:ELWxxDGT repeat protein
MIRRNALAESLESRLFLSASLVKDINTTQLALPGTWNWMATGTNTVFLSQDDGVAGWELYKTDGTAAGTVLVKDIWPGRDNSQPRAFTHVGGTTIFFVADNGTNGAELWKSDGTLAGTVMVKDIKPGAASSGANGLVNVNGTVFFSADDGTNGFELWKSDGTEAGTVLVKDIYTGTTGFPAAPASSGPSQLINNNGTLYFRATTFASGAELWKSDGTEAGTVQVIEMYHSNNEGMVNTPMAAMGGFVYFAGRTSSGGTDLWKSDGTVPGTLRVKDLASSSTPTNIKTSGSRVYFTVTASGDNGLWTTDGTTTTNLLTGSMIGLTDVNGTLFFGSSGTLYRTDGVTLTTARTGMTFNSSTASTWANGNGTFYFGANGANGAGEELWKSNPTTGVTEMVKDIEPGTAGSGPIGMTPYGPGGTSGIIFSTFGGITGGAVFKSDGTAAGTEMLKDVYPGTADSGPFLMTPFNDKMYFVAFEPGYGLTGGELYRSDGTEAGTGIFADLMPGATGSSISAMRAHGGNLFFAANNGGGAGKELWKTDGTSVTLVKDINPSGDSGIGGMTPSGNYLYFWATTAAEGEELWRTDGTNVGTLRMSNNIALGTTINLPTDVDGALYYTVLNSSNAFTGLWRSDGFGSVGIATSFTSVSSMANVNGTLYLSANTAANGVELWKIAPGSSTPVLVKEIVASSGSSSPGNLTNVDGTLYFSATTSANGAELWKSDGTEAGTVMVKDIRPGSSGSIAVQPQFTASTGVLYFRADDGVTGSELWRSDGTAAGTYLLKDITPAGASSGTPTRFFAANGFVYFGATDDNSISLEAWRTDGTTAGTIPVGNYFPANSFINNPANVAFGAALNGQFYYAFNDDTHGRELWKADQPDFAVPDAGGVLTISGTGGNDSINVSSGGGGSLTVTLNGLTESFAPGAVTSVVIAGRVGADTVNVTGGSVTFADGDSGADSANLTIHVAPGASATFGGTQQVAALVIDAGGNVALTAGGDAVLVTSALSVAGAGSLNLNDNALVLRGGGTTGAALVENLLRQGFNGGNWNGVGGITSGAAATDPTSSTALGHASNAVLNKTSFAGVTGLTATDVLVKYTYAGDANLDGQVDIGDLGLLAGAWQQPSGKTWFDGDFTYDGAVNIGDLGLLAGNWQKGVGNPL